LEYYKSLNRRLVDLLSSRSEKSWADYPEMSDETALVSSSLLASIMSTSYIVNPPLFPIVGLQGALLTLEYGLNAWSPFFFGGIALVNVSLVAPKTPENEAVKLIQFSTQLIEIVREMLDIQITARSETKGLMMLAFVVPWIEPLEQGIEFAQQTYLSGYRTGDTLYGSYGAYHYAMQTFVAGTDLTAYKCQLADYDSSLRKMGQVFTPQLLEIQLQTVQNLREASSDPHILQGTYFNEVEWLPTALSSNDFAGRHTYSIYKLMLAYYFDIDNKLDEYSREAENLLAGGSAQFTIPVFYLYFPLSKLRLVASDTNNRVETMNLINDYLKLLSIWSQFSPTTFQHMYDLIAAEKARVLGDLSEAIDHYEQAIIGARENGFTHDEALANELYARLWIERGNDRFGGLLMREAHSLYRKWGALAKANHLVERYPSLLITQSISNLGTNALDLHSVFKTSQTIAGEIALDKLLAKIMHIVIENAGAQNGFLILPSGDDWIIEAFANADQSNVQVLQSISIKENDMVSSGIIHYVAHTQETIVLSDAANEGNFTNDETIQQRQSRSILCSPLITQGRIIGILYLENNLTSGIFTPERLELLKILSSEMALALDNAQVYRNLEQSEKRFRATFEQAAVGIAHVSPEGKFLRINKKFCDIVGYSYEEMLNLTFQEITHPDDVDADLHYVGQVLNGEIETYSLEKRYFRKGGKIVWIHLTVSLVRDEADQPQWFVAVVKDINERKQAEEELRRNRDFLKHLTSAVPDAIFSIKIPERTINWANDSYNIMGYEPEEYIGQSTEKYYANPEDYTKVGSLQQEAIHRGEDMVSTEIMVLRKDGKVIPAELTATFYKEKGNVSRVTACVRDISKIKKSEEVIQESERYIRLLLDSTAEAIYGLDIEGNCTFANPSCIRLLGYETTDDLIGKNMHDLIHYSYSDGTPYPKEQCLIYQSHKTGEGVHVTDEVLWKADGTNFPVEYWSYPIYKDNCVVGSVMTFLDITERKRAANDLIKSEAKYRNFVDNSMVGIFRSTLGGQLLFVNEAMCRMYNFDNCEQMITKGGIARWKDPKQREQMLIGLKEQGSVTNFEAETITHTGRNIHVIFSAKLEADGISGMVMDITDRKKAEQEILDYQKKLRELSNQMILAEEKQRRHIATDLHDHVGQMLASSRMQIAAINKSMKKEEILKKLNNISGGLHDSIKVTQNAIFDLSPPQLNKLGLAAALSDWMHKEIEGKHEIKYELSSSAKKYQINKDLRYLLFRCACELLINVVKHARASKVTVNIKKQNDNLSVAVQDNGSGFNFNPKFVKVEDYGFGLMSIYERIENISGTVQIDTAPGKGTKVVINVPVNN